MIQSDLEAKRPSSNPSTQDGGGKGGGTIVPLRLGDETALLKNQPTNVERKERLDSTKSIPAGKLGAGDTTLHVGFLSKEEANSALSAFQNGEVIFQQWYHMPDKRSPAGPLRKLRRIKAALCNPEKDGRIPLYRFPVNDQKRYGETIPMPPALEAIRKRAAKVTGFEYNHAVVLLYRNGDDCIGFHKDKTLDLDDKAPIISISLGAERPYVLRDNIRAPKIEQEFIFPHGSLLALGPETNANFYHSVRQLKKEEETGDVRISITFRKVATFRSEDGKIITGKGAGYKSLNWPEAINGAHRLDTKLDESLKQAESVEDDAKARTVREAHHQAHEKRMAERKAAKKQKQRSLDKTKIEEKLSGVNRDDGESLKDLKISLNSPNLKRLMGLVRKDIKNFALPGVNIDDKGIEQELSSLVGKFLGAKVASSKNAEA